MKIKNKILWTVLLCLVFFSTNLSLAVALDNDENIYSCSSSTSKKCKYFNGSLGSCRYGDDCRFSHDTTTRYYEKESAQKCKYFNGSPGSCRYGDDCKFSHDTTTRYCEKEAAQRCKYFNGSQGSCRYGDDCKFSHAIIMERNVEIIRLYKILLEDYGTVGSLPKLQDRLHEIIEAYTDREKQNVGTTDPLAAKIKKMALKAIAFLEETDYVIEAQSSDGDREGEEGRELWVTMGIIKKTMKKDLFGEAAFKVKSARRKYQSRASDYHNSSDEDEYSHIMETNGTFSAEYMRGYGGYFD